MLLDSLGACCQKHQSKQEQYKENCEHEESSVLVLLVRDMMIDINHRIRELHLLNQVLEDHSGHIGSALIGKADAPIHSSTFSIALYSDLHKLIIHLFVFQAFVVSSKSENGSS